MPDITPLPRRIAWFAPWTWTRRWLWITVSAVLSVVYPLSIGPAFWLAKEGWLPYAFVGLAYIPLVAAARQFPTTEMILWQYVRWFDPRID